MEGAQGTAERRAPSHNDGHIGAHFLTPQPARLPARAFHRGRLLPTRLPARQPASPPIR